MGLEGLRRGLRELTIEASEAEAQSALRHLGVPPHDRLGLRLEQFRSILENPLAPPEPDKGAMPHTAMPHRHRREQQHRRRASREKKHAQRAHEAKAKPGSGVGRRLRPGSTHDTAGSGRHPHHHHHHGHRRTHGHRSHGPWNPLHNLLCI